MTNEKRPLKVFLCHASADKPKVRDLYRYLKRRGLQPWLDAEDLLPGQAWQVEIPKAIETSDAIIICLSKGSVDKEGYVQKEIKFALDKALEMPEGRIFIIPARLDECEVPYGLKKYQWVDLFDDGGYSRLMKSLKERASQLELAAVQVSKQDENSPYLTEKTKQESYEGVSVDVNGNVLGNIIVGNENAVQSQTLQFDPEKPVIAKSSIGIGKKEQRVTDFDQYSKTITPYEHDIRFGQGDPDAIAYQKYIEQNPELRNLVNNMGDVLKHVTFRQGLLLTPRVVPSISEKPFEAKSSIAGPKIESRKPVLHPLPIKELAKPPRKLKTEYIVAIIGAVATILAALIGILPQIIKPIPTPTAVITAKIPATQAQTAKFTDLPLSETPEPSLVPTKTHTPAITPTPLPKVYDPHPETDDYHDSFGVPMRLVSAGTFIMGSDTGRVDEKPAHMVDLPAFYIDKYEVTNRLYRDCVQTRVCKPPQEPSLSTQKDYFSNVAYDDYPVIGVDWTKAKTYCEWRGASLPTEAEWEKAARGTDKRTYPWGEEGNICAYANGIACGFANTMPVGYFERGISPYDVYDMAGNVYEWVADLFDVYPGGNPISSNRWEFGKTLRVIRGGSYFMNGSDNVTTLRTTFRMGVNPESSELDMGFRCAKSIP
jgi:formylglycine-generating enzyme required for sulfatase activity